MGREVGGGGPQARQIPGGIRCRRHDATGTQGVLAQLDETRKTAEHELEAQRDQEQYMRTLEADRDVLLDSLEAQAPEALDSLMPEQRHQWYKLLKLRVGVFADGNVEVSWAGSASSVAVCETGTLSLP